MATPLTAIARPAIVFAWRSRPGSEILERPALSTATQTSMVAMVIAENTKATKKTKLQSWAAAGTMNSGISASQGPSTKMMNKLHLEIEASGWPWASPRAWAAACSSGLSTACVCCLPRAVRTAETAA